MTLPSILAASLLLGTSAVAATGPPVSPPNPPSPPKQLREIGRVRVSVCGNIVVHANGAISSALRNDATLRNAVSRLRSVDLEGDPLTVHRGVSELDNLAARIHDNAVRGVGEVQRLRELAKGAKDPARKVDLEAFADALGGALYRQKQMAADLSGFIAYLQAREMAKIPDMGKSVVMERPNSPGMIPAPEVQASPFALWSNSHRSAREMAEMAASDFEQRSAEIQSDEGAAADHAEGAVSGC